MSKMDDSINTKVKLNYVNLKKSTKPKLRMLAKQHNLTMGGLCRKIIEEYVEDNWV